MTALRPFLDPRLIFFPLFWYPILLPLLVTVLGVIADLLVASHGTELRIHTLSVPALVLSSCKYANISFVSTDLWALTTLIMCTARGHLQGLPAVALCLGTLLGLFFHMVVFLAVSLLSRDSASAWMALGLSVLGLIGVLLIRGTVFRRVELPELGIRAV